MRKPLLIVIAGPNGSGKTTITSRVIRHQWAESSEYIMGVKTKCTKGKVVRVGCNML